MAVAQGTCPSCGAPIEFGIGSSLAKVCDYCRATIVRSDRGLENLGKVADLAQTPSLIAIGDQGTLGGRPFEVLGRVQLDHGKGPWDEYYVSFDYGQAWGWLAYAQGQWHVTTPLSGIAIPPYQSLALEMDVALGPSGAFRIAEIKSGRIVSAEGELPGAFPPGFERYYADCYGPNNAFATLDYGDNRGGTYTVFTGWIFGETQMQVTQLGPRSVNKVTAQQIKCPQCGGDIPKLAGDRAERVGCPYCGAVSDIALQQVVAQQERAMQMPEIPIGSRGTFEGAEYVCIAYMRRSSDFEGERYTWEEYLLWSEQIGYRWLVKDPETGWTWVTAANLAEIDVSRAPSQVSWGGRTFSLRNQNTARVDYVLGEVYWKCELGETTQVTDFTSGGEVLSREASAEEVRWSYSVPIPWAVIAGAFGLPLGAGGAAAAGGGGGCGSTLVLILIILFILMICALGACGSCAGDASSGGSGVGYRGGTGVYSGGK
jgi:hypothetical protein